MEEMKEASRFAVVSFDCYYWSMLHSSRIAAFLLDIGAVRLSVDPPFTWTSGIKSPIYCDNRMLYSHPAARTEIVDALVATVNTLSKKPDVIAGTATAAIGWGALVADRMQLPFVYVRSKPKEHGAKKRIEGDLKPDRHIVLIEDLISTGGSSIDAVEALREEGKGIVTDVVALFTYELSAAAEKESAAQITFHPLSSLSALLQTAREHDRITEDDSAEIRRFAKDPKGWRV